MCITIVAHILAALSCVLQFCILPKWLVYSSTKQNNNLFSSQKTKIDDKPIRIDQDAILTDQKPGEREGLIVLCYQNLYYNKKASQINERLRTINLLLDVLVLLKY